MMRLIWRPAWLASLYQRCRITGLTERRTRGADAGARTGTGNPRRSPWCRDVLRCHAWSFSASIPPACHVLAAVKNKP